MRTPNETIKGRIVGYDEQKGDLLIRAQYQDYYMMDKRKYNTCNVQLIDGRPLSDQQRKCCYALLGEIADWMGEEKTYTKELMKLEYLTNELQDLGEQIFSLSSAPMSLVCGFQRYLVSFIVRNDIPTKIKLIDYVDDVYDYVYACLINKKCCVCGLKADLHHVDAVGMGNNRDDINHLGLNVLPLCREHHTQAHQLGQESFKEMYHLIDGIPVDKTLAKIYKLKSK